MEALQQRKCLFCDCGFEVTGLRDTEQHRQSKRHKRAQSLAVNKMRRLDSYFAKAVAREGTAMETEELDNILEARQLVSQFS